MNAIYILYLESGPRRKTTMVHVLDLLGCVATGPTTEAALTATPAAIGDFLTLLHKYGADVAPAAAVETEIAEHITEGFWLGRGDPALVFGPDRLPLTPVDGERFMQRLAWMGTEMAALLAPLTPAQMATEPAGGRSLNDILDHLLESEMHYVRAFGRIQALPGAGSIAKKRQGSRLEWLAHVRQHEFARLRALSDQERTDAFTHWGQTQTARKVMRRMLEHQWEHLQEIRTRIDERDGNG